jgi:hypothetical protein
MSSWMSANSKSFVNGYTGQMVRATQPQNRKKSANIQRHQG